MGNLTPWRGAQVKPANQACRWEADVDRYVRSLPLARTQLWHTIEKQAKHALLLQVGLENERDLRDFHLYAGLSRPKPAHTVDFVYLTIIQIDSRLGEGVKQRLADVIIHVSAHPIRANQHRVQLQTALYGQTEAIRVAQNGVVDLFNIGSARF